MIQDTTVQKLMAISTPKTFKANEYVCNEGQPGEEMLYYFERQRRHLRRKRAGNARGSFAHYVGRFLRRNGGFQ